MNKYTTTSHEELIEQIIHEFVKQCNYVLMPSFKKQLYTHAKKAAETCIKNNVTPHIYVSAQVFFSPVLKGYTSLIPTQLATKDAQRYLDEYIALHWDVSPEEEFNSQCERYVHYIENGWDPALCLKNESFDFMSWFRILMYPTKDAEMIKKYGAAARQLLLMQPKLLEFLRSVESGGEKLDLTRIPKI
jgi:hypothetical protein